MHMYMHVYMYIYRERVLFLVDTHLQEDSGDFG